MALKSKSEGSSRALHFVGRMYRWAAWFGLLAAILLAAWGFIDQWNVAVRWEKDLFRVFLSSAAFGGAFFIAGLFFCGMMFLVSLLIEAGLKMLDNSNTQVDLMRRLVRQQSDVKSTTRLGENAVSTQANLTQHVVEAHQNRQRGQ